MNFFATSYIPSECFTVDAYRIQFFTKPCVMRWIPSWCPHILWWVSWSLELNKQSQIVHRLHSIFVCFERGGIVKNPKQTELLLFASTGSHWKKHISSRQKGQDPNSSVVDPGFPRRGALTPEECSLTYYFMGNGHMGPPTPVDRMTDWRTDTTENITFLQLRRQVVNIYISKFQVVPTPSTPPSQHPLNPSHAHMSTLLDPASHTP